jgi:hypothetical protein
VIGIAFSSLQSLPCTDPDSQSYRFICTYKGCQHRTETRPCAHSMSSRGSLCMRMSWRRTSAVLCLSANMLVLAAPHVDASANRRARPVFLRWHAAAALAVACVAKPHMKHNIIEASRCSNHAERPPIFSSRNTPSDISVNREIRVFLKNLSLQGPPLCTFVSPIEFTRSAV